MLLLLKEPPASGETTNAEVPQAGERDKFSASAKHNQNCYRGFGSKNSGQYPQNDEGTRKNAGVLLKMFGAFFVALLFTLLVMFAISTVFGPTPHGATTMRYASFNWLKGAEVEAITTYPLVKSAHADQLKRHQAPPVKDTVPSAESNKVRRVLRKKRRNHRRFVHYSRRDTAYSCGCAKQ